MDKRMTKRAADVLEKLGVGALLIGMFQFRLYPFLLGVAMLYGCFYLTRRT